MWLFGLVLRDDFSTDSDIDVLVEFDPDHVPGWSFYTWADELADIFGRPVDVTTPKSLNHSIRDQVMQSARLVYVLGGVSA